VISSSTKNLFIRALLHWFSKNARDLPWRRTQDPYAIWISEIMLQQTQVKTVVPYWERWMKTLPDVKSLAYAKPEAVLKLWEGLGYYTRARNLQNAAHEICTKHNGEFPLVFDDILALPGIGRYTAGAIASIAFNEPRPILDGNVIRVLTRIFGIVKNPREKHTNARLWHLAEDLVTHAARRSSFLNQSLMELGALICTPRNPKCLLCPVRKCCTAFRENRVDQLPNLDKRVTITPRRFVVFVVSRSGKYLVRQRPTGVVNAKLWEFPNIETTANDPHSTARTVFGFNSFPLQSLCTIKHSITRYRITLDVYRGTMNGSRLQFPFKGRWCSLKDFEQLSFPSAHRKILRQLVT
jgi:A/G-specific adenine glycosylase